MDNRELKLILSCNGKTLPLGKGYDFDIEKVTGLESARFEAQYSNLAMSDGEELMYKKIGARMIHIEASLKNTRLNQAYRVDVTKFFNPKFTGSLYVNNMGVEREIDYEIEGWEFMGQENLWCPLGIIVDLKCPDPFMKGLTASGDKVTKSSKMFSFPYVSLAHRTEIEGDMEKRGYAGTVMSYQIPESQTVITNDGDVPTGYVVRMKARGPVSNPRMVNEDTGKRLRMVMDMAEGDVLIITVSDRVRTIRLNDQNCYQKIDRSSSPFLLDVGENHLTFFADEGFANLDIDLKYSLRYLGV